MINEATPKLLRAIATGTDAKEAKHDIILIDAADQIDALRKTQMELIVVLRTITDHFADVMGGPLISGRGITFANGVGGIPTIAAARVALAKAVSS